MLAAQHEDNRFFDSLLCAAEGKILHRLAYPAGNPADIHRRLQPQRCFLLLSIVILTLQTWIFI